MLYKSWNGPRGEEALCGGGWHPELDKGPQSLPLLDFACNMEIKY